jgi:hypothetical protein
MVSTHNSSNGSVVGNTHNLFRWVRGGQHSQTLQVGQGWAALITSSGGSGVGSTHNLFRWARDRAAHNLFFLVKGGQRSLQIGQGTAALRTSSGGSGVGSTPNLFRWVRGGQHSQPLQVGQG